MILADVLGNPNHYGDPSGGLLPGGAGRFLLAAGAAALIWRFITVFDKKRK